MLRKYKNIILDLSLKKIYQKFFLNDIKNTGYFYYLKNLYFLFLKKKFPELEQISFDKNINLLLNYDGIDTLDLYHLVFEPDLSKDLNKYYKLQEKQIFLRFLKYSLIPKHITKKYADIYSYCINHINQPLNILEIGGGLPHGLMYKIWKKEKSFFKNITYIEADMLHAEFFNWYCKENEIKIETKFFPASKTPSISNIDYNFVFAKDIFEHLDDPKKLIKDLIDNTKNSKTLLCLDLEHKGKKTTQHINPNLPLFKKDLIDSGFHVIKKFGDVHIWKKM
jgi:hypothetical protein